jgi:hypothetical protein
MDENQEESGSQVLQLLAAAARESQLRAPQGLKVLEDR